FSPRKGVASKVTVLKPVRLSASDQNEPSCSTSATAMGCCVEKTRPAMPAPGGSRKASNSSVTPLVAVRNFRPPLSPSRTSTEATAELTALLAVRNKSSMARCKETVSEFETSIEAAISLNCSANDLLPEFCGLSFMLHCLIAEFHQDSESILRGRIIQMRILSAKNVRRRVN